MKINPGNGIRDKIQMGMRLFGSVIPNLIPKIPEMRFFLRIFQIKHKLLVVGVFQDFTTYFSDLAYSKPCVLSFSFHFLYIIRERRREDAANRRWERELLGQPDPPRQRRQQRQPGPLPENQGRQHARRGFFSLLFFYIKKLFSSCSDIRNIC